MKDKKQVFKTIWRNLILPLCIGTIFCLLTQSMFRYMQWGDFSGGQVSMVLYFIIHRLCSVDNK